MWTKSTRDTISWALLLMLLVAASPLWAVGTNYYVDNINGNDTYNGTNPSQAWKTLAKVNGIAAFQPGDSLLFVSGGVWNGQLRPLGSGTSANPITLGKYGGSAKPIFNGGGVNQGTVFLLNQSHWIIQELEVTNSTAQSNIYRSGISVQDSGGGVQSDIKILNNYVHDVTSNTSYGNGADPKEFGGISVLVPPAEGKSDVINDVLIQGNTVAHVGRVGITVWGWMSSDADPRKGFDTAKIAQNVRITNNVISYTDGDGIIIWGCDSGIIEYNSLDHPAQNDGFGMSAGIWAVVCRNCIYQNNESYAMHNTGDGEGFDIDGDAINTIIQYNYSHDNAGGFVLMCDSYRGAIPNTQIIRYNISQNDHSTDAGCIFQMQGFCLSLVYNNTVYVGPNDSTRICHNWGNDCPVSYTNNLFYVAGKAYYEPSTWNSWDYNLYFGNHPPSEPVDLHKVTADPLLVAPGSATIGINTLDGYKLQPGSPAIGAGVLMTNNGGKDYFGNPVSATAQPNIGAYSGIGGGTIAFIRLTVTDSTTNLPVAGAVSKISAGTPVRVIRSVANNAGSDLITVPAGSATLNVTATGKGEVVSQVLTVVNETLSIAVKLPVDRTPPLIDAVVLQNDGKTILVNFSENVDSASAALISNYLFTPTISIASATTINVKQVELKLSNWMSNDTVYTLAINGVKDISGNAMVTAFTAQVINKWPLFVKRINFQGNTPWTKEGWSSNSGGLYTAQAGFGWTSSAAFGTRDDRNGSNFLLKSIVGTGTEVVGFKINAPNGSYKVRWGVGDNQWGDYVWVAFNGDTLIKLVGAANLQRDTVITVTGDTGAVFMVRGSVNYVVMVSNVPGMCMDEVSLDGIRLGTCYGTSVEVKHEPARMSMLVSPNPFNPISHIAYSLPVSGQIRLAVYDLSGRLVKTLVSGNMTAGKHIAQWNATNTRGERVSCGVYLYRLTTPDKVLQYKSVLAK